ncbi:MAG: triphosphoribosyl-dephospho-CoA synthase [Gemmataceae bacterium]|nr:triphosphoribosyl-dephospho-CoA synthase [Gemmataceae bacterium]
MPAWSVGQCVQLACILEATARKPGNVTRFHDFADLTYLDLLVSAAAIAPIFEQASRESVGVTVLQCVERTRQACATNSNLGLVLALAPLAASEPVDNVASVLRGLTVEDSRAVFSAIRLARPGGLGRATQQDVFREPTLPLREVMALAADRDLIARQYATDFADVFQIGVPALCEPTTVRILPPWDEARRITLPLGLEESIVRCHLRLLAELGDSHIARRCGLATAEEAQRQARGVLNGQLSWGEFDAWLRADGHRRNPGSTADLTAASLFVALRSGMIEFPLRF